MKHPGGRPLAYKTEDELKEAVDQYFRDCDNHTKPMAIWTGTKTEIVDVKDPLPYTMGGLAYALEMDRRSLLNYQKREQFFPIIFRARVRVVADQERLMIKGGNAQGAGLALKNNDAWLDRQVVDQYNHDFKITRATKSATENGD